MTEPFKEAVSICKTIIRNGYDAYVINAGLQSLTLDQDGGTELDIATDLDFNSLRKLFPSIQPSRETAVAGLLTEGGLTFRFYQTDVREGSHPDETTIKLTPRMLKKLEERDELSLALACPLVPPEGDRHDGFADFDKGLVQFVGLPDEALKRDYLRGVRALRFSANYGLPLDRNTRMAIVRANQLILDYVPVSDIMDEWRKIEAENLWKFVQLLFDTQLLHGLIPEVAALSRVTQMKNEHEEQTVLEHTFNLMKLYPEELPYDWYGTLACLFHGVGKLYTAEFFQGKWTFHNYPRVGSKIVRKIMSRLRFLPEDMDLVCYLVRHHTRFHYMLTNRGIRRFKSLDEYPRLIEMARADVKARDGNYTEFNHNLKMLERAETPEENQEPLLNGNEIMEFNGLKPGPAVGVIREALLKAQIEGRVNSIPEAVEFVQSYKERQDLGN